MTWIMLDLLQDITLYLKCWYAIFSIHLVIRTMIESFILRLNCEVSFSLFSLFLKRKKENLIMPVFWGIGSLRNQ